MLVPRWLYFPAPQVAACYKTSRGSASQTLLALGGRELGAEPDVSGGINTWNHSDSVPIQNRLTERQEESCVDLSSPLFVNRTVQSRMYSLLVVRSKYTRQSSVG